MKRLKAISVLVSAAMCMSMVMTPVSVIADETSAPAETQNIEETEKPKPKETQNPAPKETEKQEPKETEKPAPSETEKREPSETEKQEPKETEKPAPSETEKQEPSETEKQEPSETEKQEPSETEQKAPEETTEASEPQESGYDEPAHSEEPEASESGPKEADDENVTKAPKNDYDEDDDELGTIANVKVTNGVLSWDKYGKACRYEVYVFKINIYDDEGTSCSLNTEIDELIKNGSITKGDSYKIRIEAYEYQADYDNYYLVAKTDYRHTYKSPATTKGIFANVKVNEGLLTWDKVTGASYYEVDIRESMRNYVDSVEVAVTSIKISDWINSLVKNNKLAKSGKCLIELYAVDADDKCFADYKIEYTYKSSENPKPLGTIKNVRMDNYYLKWDDFANANYYEIRVSEQFDIAWIKNNLLKYWTFENKYERDKLNYQIDWYVKDGKVKKTNPYAIVINAYDDNSDIIATATYYYAYISPVDPINVGSISAKIENGILTWKPLKGKYSWANYEYELLVCSPEVFKYYYEDQLKGYWKTLPITDWSININDEIEDMIRSNLINKSNTYIIVIQAMDTDGHIVAETRLDSKTLNISGVKTVKAKAKKLRKKSKSVARNKIMTLSDTKGSVTYALNKVNKKKKYFKINKYNGKLTLKKKMPKGKYKVTYRITASGNDFYAKATRDVTVTVRVK